MRLFVDQLTNLDFSYLHPTRGLIGETWIAGVELSGTLDEQGMVVDFGKVKRVLRDWLDAQIDHKLLVPAQSPLLSVNEDKGYCELEWRAESGTVSTRGPQGALCLLPCADIDKASVAQYCRSALMEIFPEVDDLNIRFHHESISGPYYHYSHGLKKHRGNCQRICHGHRSRIEIWRNGEPDQKLMQEWAERWRDIYIGTREDLSAAADNRLEFSYVSQQGEFFLSLPESRCYLIDSDSTVELIATHLAEEIRSTCPQDSIRVRAYEGLAKGAEVDLPAPHDFS